MMRTGPSWIAIIGCLSATGCKPADTAGNESQSMAQPTAQAADRGGDDGITLIPPGFERAAAGPSHLFYLAGDTFGAIDPIDQELIFVDSSGKQLGTISLPAGFDVRGIDLGTDVVLRGDDSAIVLARREGLPSELKTTALPAPATSVSRKGSSLALNIAGAEGNQSLAINPDVGASVDAAQFLGRDKNGNAYAFWQEESKGPRITAWVGKFDASGKMLLSNRVNLSSFAAVPALPVAVTASGKVMMMRPTADSVQLVEVMLAQGGRAGTEGSVVKVPTKTLDLGDVEVIDPNQFARAGGAPPTYDPTFGQAAVTRGKAFLDATWTLAPANFLAEIAHKCSPSAGNFWLRPRRLTQSQIGKTVTALPYKWGGFDSVSQYKQKMVANKPFLAGDVCTCRQDSYNQCMVPRAAGIDCSGFVSRAWGLSSHTGTSQLGSISGQLASLRDLKPGDALNKPGSHVRLFVRFEPGPELKIRTLESAVSCGGVCEKVYSPIELSGYRPIRYRQGH